MPVSTVWRSSLCPDSAWIHKRNKREREDEDLTWEVFTDTRSTDKSVSRLSCIFWVLLRTTWNYHNIVNQLYPNTEGNGNPLQYSCLENPRDRRAWWGAVYGVTQSQTRLKQLSSSIPQYKINSWKKRVCINSKHWVLEVRDGRLRLAWSSWAWLNRRGGDWVDT